MSDDPLFVDNRIYCQYHGKEHPEEWSSEDEWIFWVKNKKVFNPFSDHGQVHSDAINDVVMRIC